MHRFTALDPSQCLEYRKLLLSSCYDSTVHSMALHRRGNALNVLRSAPQKALDFWCFDLFKRLIMGDASGSSSGGGSSSKEKDRRALTESEAAARTFIAAGLAGKCAVLCTGPCGPRVAF
jgi:hypothetical protein